MLEIEQEFEDCKWGSGWFEYYDFDLFNFVDKLIDFDCRLFDLIYMVFDMEIIGLEFFKGDEIIQIGVVCIVNNCLLWQEIFDQIIDLECLFKFELILIYGIIEDMVCGKLMIDVILLFFYEFCEDIVLIVYNVVFDMCFL